MKKYLSLITISLLTLAFQACSWVPAPYGINDEDIDDGGGSQPIAEAEGDGTANNPYNCVAALQLGKTLASGQTTENSVYIKGRIVSIKEEYSTQFGNGTFYISDDGTSNNQFYVFRALYLGNKKYQAGQTQIKENDEVVVCGKITNYSGTIETQQYEAYLVQLNDEKEDAGGDGGDTQIPEGAILYAPFNTALTSNLGDFFTYDNAQSGYNWTYNSTYKCAYMTSYESSTKVNHPADSWLISPAMDLSNVNAAYVTLDYKLAYASGNNSEYRVLIGRGFSSGMSPGRINWVELPVTWTMLNSFSGAAWSNPGKLSIPSEFLGKNDVHVAIEYISTNKAATWEIQNLIVAQGEGDAQPTNPDDGDDPTVGDETSYNGDITDTGITLDFSKLGLSDGTTLTTLTLADGTKLTFDKNGGNNVPKYYNIDKSARLYALNKLTIETATPNRPIRQVVIHTVANYEGNETLEAQATGSLPTLTREAGSGYVSISNVSNYILDIINTHSSNKGGTQLRITSIDITY